MCQFFSLVSDGKGKIMYFDWKLREKCLKGELKDINPDSHTSIADYFGYKGEKEDKLNKHEYNPLTKEFTTDQLNTKNDSRQVRQFCRTLDFKKIIPQLKLAPIVNPFEIKPPKEITKQHLNLLKKWASVGASVGDSVGDSVWNSVWNSVRAYASSYFDLDEWKYIKHKKGENPYQPLIDLWLQGLVPSYDGKVWRLHGGRKAKILWEGKL